MELEGIKQKDRIEEYEGYIRFREWIPRARKAANLNMDVYV